MKCKFCDHTVYPMHKVCNKCGKRITHPFFRNAWFLLVPIFVTFLGLGIWDSKGTEMQSLVAPILSSSALETPIQTTLSSGSFVIGKTLSPGRYIITTPKGVGNIFIYKEQFPYINEILTHPHDSNTTVGVTKIETSLQKGMLLQISGLDEVVFSPVPRFNKTSLVCGYHIVGKDIPPGDYLVTIPKGSGNLMVYDNTHKLKINELLIADIIDSEKELQITLIAGEVVVVSHLDNIAFIPI